jgi:arabinose-5-phosphate isomerase
MVLLEMRGFDEKDFAKFHPGGRLGRVLLQRVSDIMRGESRMPKVGPETDILAVLHSMNEHRAGVAVIVSSSGKLAGIFTHGDFVRAFERNPGMVSDAVGQHMVRHPITIRETKLAVEILNLLDQHRIDDLIVVNENNEPVGIVDSQDLTKLKLL